MNFLEKDLETIILETDNELLFDRELYILGKKYRQLRIGNYGIADIVTIKKKYEEGRSRISPYLEITIFELKKEKIGISAFLQSIKYAKGIKTYLEEKKCNIEFIINITLCAKDIDLSGEFIYITNLFKNDYPNFGYINDIEFYTFSYEFNGIKFNRKQHYNLIHKGF